MCNLIITKKGKTCSNHMLTKELPGASHSLQLLRGQAPYQI